MDYNALGHMPRRQFSHVSAEFLVNRSGVLAPASEGSYKLLILLNLVAWWGNLIVI